MCKDLRNSQIFVLPGGFSAGDEPDGSGKFMAAVLQNPKLMDEIKAFLGRDGLILGVCNGFQALVKSGLFTLWRNWKMFMKILLLLHLTR